MKYVNFIVWVMFQNIFDNMKKTRLYGYVWLCSWFYSDSIDADILNIMIKGKAYWCWYFKYNYLKEKHNIKY